MAYLFKIALAALSLIATVNVNAESCQALPKAENISGVLLWRLSDHKNYWSFTKPSSESYKEFFQWASKQPNLHPAEAKVRALRDAYAERDIKPVVERLDRILNGEVGRLRSVTCIEALLLSAANSMRRQAEVPYEFGALVLSRMARSGQRELKIYLQLGSPWSVSLEASRKLAIADLSAGWSLLAHLHNHPFSNNPAFAAHAGYTAPGESDLRTYIALKNHGLAEAWITNGVHTFEMKHAEFEL